ncbi:MAG: murein biosynthesis integral membrane protein MurJ [Nitrospinae bacterium]|nr:murein biosynthesis integral membrane protein MurJ [Nitrospinota bacterium]
MRTEETITTAAGVVGLATTLSRVLGFMRDIVIARIFGASMAADAFFVAFAIPSLLRRVVGEGSLSVSIVPVVTEYARRKGRGELWDLSNALFCAMALLLLVLTGVGMLAAPWIVPALVPGFWASPEKLGLTIALTRLMFPFLFFIGLASVAMGVLNSLGHFAAPALAPVALNVAMITCALGVSPYLETPIYGLAAGVLLGGALQFLLQAPVLARRGLPLRLVWNWRHPGLARIMWLTLPALFGLAVAELNALVDRWIASFLPEGSVSYLYYGNHLMQFPLAIFGTAMSVAVLPVLSAHAAQRDLAGLSQSVAFAIRVLLFLTVPATVALSVLRVPIVTVLFQRGEFGPQATEGTASALLYYTLGLCAYAGLKVVVPAFYALQDTKTPVRIGAYAMLLNIALSVALMFPLQHGGLALATSLSAFFNVGVLVGLLRRRIGRLQGRMILHSASKVGLASMLTGGVTGWLAWVMPPASGSGAARAMLLGGIVLAGMGCYLGLTLALRSEEAIFMLNLVRRRWVSTRG